MRITRRIATIKVEFDKEDSYAGDDMECFLSSLKEFVEKEGGGYVHAIFEVHEHGHAANPDESRGKHNGR